jgi:hypothetical protein
MNTILRSLTAMTVLIAAMIGSACEPAPVSPPAQETTQQPTDPRPPADAIAPADSDEAVESAELVDLGPMRIDMDARTVTFPAEVCLREGMLELLVAYGELKNHESILRTTVAPSALHAGLLALGLMPGMPAEALSFPDGTNKIIAPRGQRLHLTVRWTDAEGNLQEADPSVWLHTVQPGTQVPNEWVFVGSQVMPSGAYWADESGDVISISNFGSSLIDVPFESTNQDANLIYSADTPLIPPLGTPVEVIISPVSNPVQESYATQYIYVDALGQVDVDGRQMSLEELGQWAYRFVGQHLRARIVIMIHPRTQANTVQQVYETLRGNAVLDIREVRMYLDGPWLPLTPAQAETALADLADRFDHPLDYIEDPAKVAADTLAAIAVRRAELQRELELLEVYEADLSAAIEAADASADVVAYHALCRRDTFVFHGVELRTVVEFLTSTYGVTITVDWVELEAVGVGPESATTLRLMDVPLSAALQAVLDDVSPDGVFLSYVVQDGVIHISTLSALQTMGR